MLHMVFQVPRNRLYLVVPRIVGIVAMAVITGGFDDALDIFWHLVNDHKIRFGYQIALIAIGGHKLYAHQRDQQDPPCDLYRLHLIDLLLYTTAGHHFASVVRVLDFFGGT